MSRDPATLSRRAVLATALAAAAVPLLAPATVDAQDLPQAGAAPSIEPGAVAQEAPHADLLAAAAELTPLETVIVAREGAVVAEQGYRGHALSAPTNIKSASKAVIAALVGIAIDRGVLEGVDQPVAPVLRDSIPADADPRIEDITVGNLLSMQAGLRPTSGPEYGAWVSSRNWVRGALAQPFEDDPGGRMLYSTGS
jgi:CubicO group peptidase (beta-lactamase class C family)